MAAVLAIYGAGSLDLALITGFAEAEPAYLYFSSSEKDGELTVTMYTSGTTLKNVACFDMELEYNSKVLKYSSGQMENIGGSLSSVSEKDGKIRLSFVNSDGFNISDRTIASLTFTMIQEGEFTALFRYTVKEMTDSIMNKLEFSEMSGEFTWAFVNDGRSYYQYYMSNYGKSVKIGETYSSEIVFSSSGGITSGSFVLSFYRSGADLISIEPTKWAKGTVVSINDVGDDYMARYNVAFACTETVENAVPFLTINAVPKAEGNQWFWLNDFKVTSPQLKTAAISSYSLYMDVVSGEKNQTSFKVSAPEKIASCEETVDVEIELSDNTGFSALTAELEYDSSLFEFVSGAVKDGAFKNAFSSVSGAYAGKVKIGVASTVQQETDGVFAVIRLKQKQQQSENSTQLKFNVTELVDSNYEPVAFSTVPAQVRLTNAHEYMDTLIEPTETEPGYTLHTCILCGHSYKDNFTGMNGALQLDVIDRSDLTDLTVRIYPSDTDDKDIIKDMAKAEAELGAECSSTVEDIASSAENQRTLTVSFSAQAPEAGTVKIAVSLGKQYRPYIAEVSDFSDLSGTLMLWGDVDGDGKVDRSDATILSRTVSKWSGYSDMIKDMGIADIDGDNAVNRADATFLSRFISKWSGSEEILYRLK